MQTLIQEANSMFCGDTYATELSGVKIASITDDEVICTMDITPKHFNAAGSVMGGAIFTLADFTFAVAANFHKQLTVSLDSQISFLGVAKGSQLIAKSHCLKEGRSTCFYEIYVSDNLDNLVAKVNITGFIKSPN